MCAHYAIFFASFPLQPINTRSFGAETPATDESARKTPLNLERHSSHSLFRGFRQATNQSPACAETASCRVTRDTSRRQFE
ncbi:hypothetical protein BaRGS_00017663 [Batillaria attramentaria]|uniref:Secreted protein n=1 Tax=Batillaria attramentaria TaxID=370345 RepID=A0ABD0KV56_9CAEN